MQTVEGTEDCAAPFYVRIFSWKVLGQRIDPRLCSLVTGVAVYAAFLGLACVTGDAAQLLILWAFHGSTLSFVLGTFLLLDALRRTSRVLTALHGLCPTDECKSFVARNLKRMHRSPWQYVLCGSGVTLYGVLLFLLGAPRLPLSLAFLIPGFIGGAFIVFVIFCGIWLAVTSAGFVIGLMRRGDLTLLPGVPGATRSLREISNWIGTMSVYFAMEAVVLLLTITAQKWPNSSVYASVIISVVSAGVLFMTMYFVLPQFSIVMALRREKSKQLAIWGDRLGEALHSCLEAPSPAEILPYCLMLNTICTSPDRPVSLTGSVKAIVSVILPIAALFPQYAEIVKAAVAAFGKVGAP